MKVTKTVSALTAKPTAQGTTRWALMSSDSIWYSTFDSKIGKEIEKLSKGDAVTIEYQMSEDGQFANLVSVVKAEGAEKEEAVKKEATTESTKQSSIKKQSAAKVAAFILSSLDLDGMSNAERMGVFKATWKTIQEEFEKLD